MNEELVDRVVHAVLYEGYILYPYRASAKKNRQRFTFGRVYPEAYSLAEKGAEPFLMQTECLLEGEAPSLEVTVRFLHPLARVIAEPPLPGIGNRASESSERTVPELWVGDTLYQSWQEAVERKVKAPLHSLQSLSRQAETLAFRFPESTQREPILDGAERVAGTIVRRQRAVEGRVEIACNEVEPGLFKITVRIVNTSVLAPGCVADHEAVLLRTFASTHTILRAEEGKFVSLIDPPPSRAPFAAACQNIGTWPVLVGEEDKDMRDAMVSSPIILYDYPKIAPESPGDLFDAAEIDEILSLRILAMTDHEKREMRNVDENARRILERTETLPEEQFLRMHGAVRNLQPVDEDFFNPGNRIETVSVGGVPLRVGSRVRIRPRAHADVIDLALAGKIAVVEAIECDAENRIQLALVLDEDPGKDLGMMRQPGHRFFYGTDEIEPITEGP